MEEQEFITYRKFTDGEEAAELAELFKKKDIPVFLKISPLSFDVSFARSENMNEYLVQLHAEDFATAECILLKESEHLLNDIEEDYHLLDYSNEELRDIVSKPDEWNHFDYLLAQKLLKDRGDEIQETELKALKENRLKKLSEPESISFFWIALGYITAFLGGIFGILIGYVIAYSKKSLPTGERIYSYKESDRKHGTNIFVLAITVAIIALILRFIVGINSI